MKKALFILVFPLNLTSFAQILNDSISDNLDTLNYHKSFFQMDFPSNCSIGINWVSESWRYDEVTDKEVGDGITNDYVEYELKIENDTNRRIVIYASNVGRNDGILNNCTDQICAWKVGHIEIQHFKFDDNFYEISGKGNNSGRLFYRYVQYGNNYVTYIDCKYDAKYSESIEPVLNHLVGTLRSY